jgi:hypothetical protein
MQPLIAVALVLGLLWAAVRFLKARKLALPVLNRASRQECGLEFLGRLPLTPQHTLFRLGVYPNGLVLLDGSAEIHRHREPGPSGGGKILA